MRNSERSYTLEFQGERKFLGIPPDPMNFSAKNDVAALDHVKAVFGIHVKPTRKLLERLGVRRFVCTVGGNQVRVAPW